MKKKIIVICNDNCIKNFKYIKKENLKEIVFLSPLLEQKFQNDINFKYNNANAKPDYNVKKNIIIKTFNIIDNLRNSIPFFKNNIIHFKSCYHFLYIILNSIQYLNFIIKDSDEYIYFDRNWVSSKNKENVVNFISNYYLKNQIGAFNIPKYNKINFSFIIHAYNYLLLKKLKKKKKFLFSATNYGFNNIFKEIKSKYPHIENLVIQKSSKHTYLLCLKFFFLDIILFRKKNYYTLFQIPSKKKFTEYFDSNKFNKHLEAHKFYNNNIDTIINNICNDVDQNIDYNFKLISLAKPSKFLAHHARWGDVLISVNNANKLKIPVYLISHGSHCVNDDDFINKETYIHLKDMLISPYANKLIAQSPIAFKTIDYFYKTKNVIKSKPIMWGYKKFQKKKKNIDKFTILHAGTTKNLLTRPFMYETSFEYLRGLHKLSNEVKKIENCILIIKFRSTNEINRRTIQRWIGENEKIIIKEGGDFIDDLNNSDLLVSFSSTTIEEALNLKKPVLLHGGNNYYIHLSKKLNKLDKDNKRRLPVYLPNSNLNKVLINLKKIFHNNPLLDEELNEYVYNYKNTNNYNFIENFITNNE